MAASRKSPNALYLDSTQYRKNRCVHRHGSKMAARTAAFEFSEKINVNGEDEGEKGGGTSLDKDCLAGKFVLIQKTKDRKTGCVVGKWMTNGVCIVNVSNRKKLERLRTGKNEGWSTK
jgi:hypothetical protein